MEKEMIGLNRYIYTFKDKETMQKYYAKLKNKGTIQEIFINNGYGFEFKKNIIL